MRVAVHSTVEWYLHVHLFITTTYVYRYLQLGSRYLDRLVLISVHFFTYMYMSVPE